MYMHGFGQNCSIRVGVDVIGAWHPENIIISPFLLLEKRKFPNLEMVGP